MNYTIILALMGGLGLFLYGMKLMSDGLEKAAGAKLRRILEIFTTNRLTGMLVGIFFTAVIQSSSAATVMVVSFVTENPSGASSGGLHRSAWLSENFW